MTQNLRTQLENLFDYAYADQDFAKQETIQDWFIKYVNNDFTIRNMFEIHGIKVTAEDLILAQEQEQEKGFTNGDLWNNIEDALVYIKKFGQDFAPDKVFDDNGIEVGYKLANGETVTYVGMNHENSY